MLLRSDQSLPTIPEPHLAMASPVFLANRIPLRLFVIGRVLRRFQIHTALNFVRYQFLTSSPREF